MSDIQTVTRLAMVAHFDDMPLELVINRGTKQGIKIGDRFLVFGIGPHITDPDTGKDLGALEVVRGQGKVVHVQDDLATIRSIGRRRTHPAKRIIRNTGNSLSLMLSGGAKVIEEELSPEVEMPFENVRIGDFAKPI